MDRKEHWEGVYRDKSPLDVSWYQAEPVISLELIEASGCGPDAAVIDVGGGASVLVDHLLARGYRSLTVLDISGRALEHARNRLGAAAGEVTWVESDVTAFAPAVVFDVWHDRAVFHFLTAAADRRRYVEVLERAVRPGGQVVLAAFAIGGPTKCSGLDIVQYDAAKLGAELGDGFRLLEQRAEEHHTPAGKVQQFAYFRFARAD